jgi:hypothetical protein
MSNRRYWIASFPPSPASKLIQIQFWPRPGVPNQLMSCWRVTVPGLLGPELASIRLRIHLLLLERNPRRKCGTGHPKSRSMIQLPTHLLLQLLRKVTGEGSISADPTGKLSWNLLLCWVLFLTSSAVQVPAR